MAQETKFFQEKTIKNYTASRIIADLILDNVVRHERRYKL